MEALRPKFVKEMKKTGLKKPEIGTFVVVGVVLWAILLWMFVNRYNKIEDTPSADRNGNIRNMNIIIIIFHIITFFPFTLLESNYLNTNIWISWFTIALAVTTTFYNGVVVANVVSDSDQPYANANKDMDISSLALQCFANSLMMAYIFRLIRSKKKMMF
jgi:hypothetical protein